MCCAWACAYTHHACVHVLLCCCACACCMCICISKSFAPSTHMCSHTHEKEVLTHWHAVLTLPLQKKGHTKLLKLVNKQPQCWHAVLTLPWQNKDKQNCSSMLSMRLTSACPLVPQATDPQAGWQSSWNFSPCFEHCMYVPTGPTIFELSNDNCKAVCSAIAYWLFSSMN